MQTSSCSSQDGKASLLCQQVTMAQSPAEARIHGCSMKCPLQQLWAQFTSKMMSQWLKHSSTAAFDIYPLPIPTSETQLQTLELRLCKTCIFTEQQLHKTSPWRCQMTLLPHSRVKVRRFTRSLTNASIDWLLKCLVINTAFEVISAEDLLYLPMFK